MPRLGTDMAHTRDFGIEITYVVFIFHVFQLLSIRFTKQNLCCISK